MIVMKFGGTSLGDPARISTACELIHASQARGEDPVVVVSAHAGVTNALLTAAKRALSGQVDILPLVNIHRRIATGLGLEPDLVTPLLMDLKDLLRGISLVRELTPRSLDFVASYGEQCSVPMLTAACRARGLEAVPVCAWDLGIVTDDRFGAAQPLAGIEPDIRARVAERQAGGVPLVTGFIAKNRAGEVTTFGRNGSDLTATLLGAALNADEVQIWTDVDGIMSADPSIVAEPRPLATLAFDEAAELAYYGARVLHPSTLRPAIAQGIAVRVLNTFKPEAPGTRIVRARVADGRPVQSIVYKEGQYVVHVTSTRMLMASGMMARIFNRLGAHGVVINLITTSEVTVSMTTDSAAHLDEAVAELETFADTVTVEADKAIVGCVGQEIRERLEVPGEVFSVLAKAGVPVDLISVGASKVNVTFVVDSCMIAPAVRALHAHFFEGRQLTAAEAREGPARAESRKVESLALAGSRPPETETGVYDLPATRAVPAPSPRDVSTP